MKKIIYIGIALFALGMTSCSKQDVQPNSPTDTVVPTWKSSITDPELNGTSGTSGTGTITDPELNGAGGDGLLNEN